MIPPCTSKTCQRPVETPTGQSQAEIIRPLFPNKRGEAQSKNSGQVLATEIGIPYLGQIPFDPRMAHTTDAGRPFVLEHSQTTAGQAIMALTQMLEVRLESP